MTLMLILLLAATTAQPAVEPPARPEVLEQAETRDTPDAASDAFAWFAATAAEHRPETSPAAAAEFDPLDPAEPEGCRRVLHEWREPVTGVAHSDYAVRCTGGFGSGDTRARNREALERLRQETRDALRGHR